MKNINLPVWVTLVLIVFTASSCEVVEAVFKAGFWTAIILIVVIAGAIMWLIGKTRRRR